MKMNFKKGLIIAVATGAMITLSSIKKGNAQVQAYKRTPKVVTLYSHDESVICHRKNKAVVNEVLYWKCLGKGNGLTSHGYYISYDSHDKWYKKGRVYKTVLVYDIKTNWTDDVRDRSDYLASKKVSTAHFSKAVKNHA